MNTQLRIMLNNIIIPEVYAMVVGLNEIIVLKRMQLLIDMESGRGFNNTIDGKVWTRKSIPEWHRHFPYWDEKTIVKALSSLEKMGVVVSSEGSNEMPGDRTKWYSINHDKFDQMVNEWAQQNPED